MTAQILDKVLRVLDPDGKPKEHRGDAEALPRGGLHFRVSLHGGEGDQRLHAAQAFSKGDELRASQESLHQGRVLHLEGDHGAEPPALPRRQLMARVAGEPRVVDLADLGVSRQPRGNRCGILLLPVQPDGERLHPPDGEPGVLRTEHGTGGVLVEAHLFRKRRLLYREEPADGVVVAREVLGPAVHRDVSSQVQRPQEVGRQEGIVYDCEKPAVLCNCGKPGDVRHLQERIGERLDEKGSRLGTHGLLHVIRGGRVDIREAQSVLAETLLEKPVGPAIEVLGDNKVVPRLEEQEEARDGRHA